MRQRANETTVPLVAETRLFVSDRGRCPPAALLLRLLPRSIADKVYNWIAAHGYMWFGERTTCFVPRRGRGRSVALERPIIGVRRIVAIALTEAARTLLDAELHHRTTGAKRPGALAGAVAVRGGRLLVRITE